MTCSEWLCVITGESSPKTCLLQASPRTFCHIHPKWLQLQARQVFCLRCKQRANLGYPWNKEILEFYPWVRWEKKWKYKDNLECHSQVQTSRANNKDWWYWASVHSVGDSNVIDAKVVKYQLPSVILFTRYRRRVHPPGNVLYGGKLYSQHLGGPLVDKRHRDDEFGQHVGELHLARTQ